MPKQTKRDDKKKKRKITVFPTGPREAAERKNRSDAAKARRRVKGKFADEPNRPKVPQADSTDPEALKVAREELRQQRLLEKAEKGTRQTEKRRRMAAFDASQREQARKDFIEQGRAEGEVARALEALGYQPEPIKGPDGQARLGYFNPVEEHWVDVEAYASDFERRKMMEEAADRVNKTRKAREEIEGDLPRVSKRVRRAEETLQKIESGEAIPPQHQVELDLADKRLAQTQTAFELAREDPDITRSELLMLQQDVQLAQEDRAQREAELRERYPHDYEKLEKEARLELGAAKGEEQRLKKQLPSLTDRERAEIDRAIADIKETSFDNPDIVIKDPSIMDEAQQQALKRELAAASQAARDARDAARQEGTYEIDGAPVFSTVEEVYTERRKGKNRYRGEDGGPDPNPKGGGWKGTASFQREQSRRRIRGIREGTDVRSYRVWDKYGVSPKKVPQQKADVSLGPNVQYVTATDKFDYIDPNDKAEATVLEFSLKNPPTYMMNVDFLMHQPQQSLGTDKHGAPIRNQSGQVKTRNATFTDLTVEETNAPTLEAAAKEVGLRGYFAEHLGDGRYRFVTEQGTAINEDQLAQLTEVLDERFGLVHSPDFDGITKVRGAELQRRFEETPFGASRPASQENASLRTRLVPVTTKSAEVKLARRDREGNLKEGDADQLLVQTPGFLQVGDERLLEPRLLSVNLQERSDAIGFGRSWRPGETEIGRVLTAVPRERKRIEMENALEKAAEGDDKDLEKLLREDNPYANDNTISYLKDELGLVGDAAVASSIYAGTRTAQRRIASKALEETRIGKWIDTKTSLSNSPWFNDAKNSLGRETMDWYAEKKWMVKHPFSDPKEQIGGIEWNSHRYRQHLISKNRREARQLERETRLARSKVRGRLAVEDAMTSEAPRGPLGRIDRKIQLRTAHLVSGESYERDALHGRIRDQIAANQAELETPRSNLSAKQAQKNLNELFGLQKELGKAGPKLPEGALEKAYQNTDIFKPGTVRKVGKVGLYGAAGVAAIGAGVFAYDKYKEHAMEKQGEEYVSVGSRIAKPLPKNVYKPTVQVKKQYTKPLPHTYLTDAIDMEGKKLIKGVKVKGKMEKVVLRPTERKDVGGDTYKQGPLIGTPSLDFRPVKGTSSVFFEKDLKTARNTTTVDRGPIYLQIGKKRRWGDTKATRLRSANPNKMSASERDIAAMDYLYGTSTDKARTANLHLGDTDFYDTVTDPEKVRQLKNRSASSYEPNISKKVRDAKGDKAKMVSEVERARLDELFHGKTVEDSDQIRRMTRNLDKDYEERHKEW